MNDDEVNGRRSVRYSLPDWMGVRNGYDEGRKHYNSDKYGIISVISLPARRRPEIDPSRILGRHVRNGRRRGEVGLPIFAKFRRIYAVAEYSLDINNNTILYNYYFL